MSKSKRRKNNRALINAVLMSDVATAKLLLDNGADVNARDLLEDNETVLILAAQSGNTQIARLLLEKGAEVDARDSEGRTALMCTSVHSEIFDLLLAKGADLHARDNEGRTKLIRIIPCAPELESVQELLNRGLDPNAKDNDGETALSTARDYGFLAVARVLELAGATQ